MERASRWLGWIGLAIILAAMVANLAPADDAASIKSQFASPPRQYSSGPLWVWNDMLTEEQVVGTLRDLAGQKVMQAFVHPRPGLMTPYLSADWFRLWKAALAEAERLDMNLWIYDENSYPSGFAGGFVPENMPESRGRSLGFKIEKRVPKMGDDVRAVFRLTGDRYKDVTAAVRSDQALPAGEYFVARLLRSDPSPWYGGKTYVDLLYPGVTQKFLEITLEPYRRQFGDQFGKRIPGSFTDEPRLEGRGGVPWTDDLPAVFEKRWGYSLMPHLPCLARNVGDWKRIRHNFLQVLLDLFIERWSRPYSEYCERSKIEWTGHYWDHEWPNCTVVPDNMAMYAWHQRPAIDCLMNQYREDTHAQFGNVRMVKELSSVANQLGRRRTLCEAYGAGGWDLRFEDMKRIGDWLYVLGVNTLDEHLSYVTIRGARKDDHPQSFSYHEPWWPDYHVLERYFTRLSLALSQGQQVSATLVLEPTTTAWMYQFQGSAEQRQHLADVGDAFQNTLLALERAQADYDIGCEDILARHGSVQTARQAPRAGRARRTLPVTRGIRLTVGQRVYETVVLPPMTENVNGPTARLLEEFLGGGGRVLCCGAPPSMVDGQPSDRMKTAARSAGWKQLEPAALSETLLGLAGNELVIRRAPDDKGILLHHRRELDDGRLLFLVNTSLESSSKGTIRCGLGSTLRGVERWDAESGTIASYPFSFGGRDIEIAFSLPPCGSLLLFLSQQARGPAPAQESQATIIPSAEPTKVRRLEPNVLTLDYLDLTIGSETKKGIYCYTAAEMAFAKHGIEHNPWDHAVQFRDEWISKTFPPDSGFTATYRFTIERDMPRSLLMVVERPDLYTIACNGKPVKAAKDQWWLDRAFGRIDVTAAAKVGENALVLKAAPMTIYHEIQPVYVLGDFSLRAAESGFVLKPPASLKLDPKGWNEQGYPFYSAGVAYSQTFEVAKPQGRYEVALPAWCGSVARVMVNGKPAGHVFHQPWQCDVTEQIRPGQNVIEVQVVGTLKNTLGPHHGKPPLGAAWPASFHKAPPSGPPLGADYSTVGYGLFEPFVLKQFAR